MGVFRKSSKKSVRATIVATTIGIMAAVGLTAGSAAAGTSRSTPRAAQGVTPTSVDIGFVTSKTGIAASSFANAENGCKARVGRENAAGGVNGRKINVVYGDDGASTNLATVQDLVQNKGVYAVVNDSPFGFLSYRWILEHGVPNVGGGYDGPQYSEPGNENLISAMGNNPVTSGIVYDFYDKAAKQLGGTKIAAVSFATPGSAAGVDTVAVAAKVVGIEVVYNNSKVDFGTTDVGPIVLGIKNAGADVGAYNMTASTNLAIVQGLAQNGVKMKAQLLSTGYGQDLLDQPIAKQLTPDVVIGSVYAPVELKTKATKRFQADLKKYADFTGVPDFGVYTGYVDCDLMIKGLKAQGDDLDPATFADGLRTKVKTFNPGDGLGCQDLDLTEATYGKPSPTNCAWNVRVKDGKFVVFKPKGGKTTYWSGKLVPESVPSTTTAPAAG